MKKCHECGGKLEESVELLIHRGKIAPLKVLKCMKCGESTSTLDDYDVARRELRPTLSEKIKNFFGSKLGCFFR